MTWVLYIWIGYAGAHSTMTMHGEFKTEQKCQEVGAFVASKNIERARINYLCVAKEKQ